MKNAKLLKTGLLKGNANLYELSEELNNSKYLIVSRADTFDHGDEVMVFPANDKGEVISWSEEYCARSENGDDVSHEAAIRELGYELI